MAQEEKDKGLYFVSVKNPVLALSTDYEEYIATSEDFKTFCNEVFDLNTDSEYDNFILKRYVRAKKKVNLVAETFTEGRTIQGFRRIVDTKKGPVKIGFTRFREHRIYVQAGEIYLRAYRVFLADLCTDNAWGFEPLNKFDNGGNIEIIEWNKRPCRKGIIYINNKLQNILYIIDAYFETKRQMDNDIKNPKPLELESFIKGLL
ncbi:MAG: hypothetical protein E7406_01545 [Ruminococcaceae bacterium]|nr:hypothetical protein [Oscillospiraceae bacterium]